MQRKRKDILRKSYQVGSFLLVFIFLFISGVQIFHSHSKVTAVEHTDTNDQLSAADKCLICDYLAHNSSKEFYISHPLVLSIPLPDATTLNNNVFVGNYKFSLQGFTNKGPPTFPANQ